MDKLAGLSNGAKIVLGGTIAFLIISFLDWQQVEFAGVSAGRSMWAGVGWIAGLLAIALIVWLVARIAGMNVELGVGPGLVTAGLAALLLLFTVIKFFADGEARNWPAWIGLILSAVIAVGAWLNMQESGESVNDLRAMGRGDSTTPPPPPASGDDTP